MKKFLTYGCVFLGLLSCENPIEPPDCTPQQEQCTDNLDNDCDTLIDAQDPDCVGVAEVCTGGIDEDEDTTIDCADTDCAADPACQITLDPGDPGVFGVNVANQTATTSLGNAGLTVYSPSLDNGASPAAGPFPLLIVSTGFQIGRDNYDQTCRHLASWGYVVIIHDYTSGNHNQKASEISDLIDFALGPQSGLSSRINANQIAVAGHSLGGKVSIGAAALDPRIGAVVGWDPVDALPPFGNDGSTSFAPELVGNITVPMALLGETTDSTGVFGQACAPAADNFQQFFNAACASSAVLEVTITNADHTDWVDDRASCGLSCLVCANGTTPDATTLTITRRVTVSWLETHLRNQTGFEEFLTNPGVGSPAVLRAAVPNCP